MSYPQYSTQQAVNTQAYLQIMRGPPGPQGPPGAPGQTIIEYRNNNSNPNIVQGATGPRGNTGPQGATGPNISASNFGEYLYWNDTLSPPQWSVGSSKINLGYHAGKNNQGQFSIAIGHQAGLQDQSSNSIVLNATGSPLNPRSSGLYVAPIRDGSSNLILVYNSNTKEISYTSSSNLINNNNSLLSSANLTLGSISLGTSVVEQSPNAIAIGAQAGQQTQGSDSIAIGAFAGFSNQLLGSIAIGSLAGNEQQGVNSIAIGDNAGFSSQSDNAIAIGTDAGNMNQGNYAIAIGNDSGNINQGDYSIAIGYQSGHMDQPSQSIVLNATGQELDGATSGCYIAPIRGGITGSQILYYQPETKEITYSSPKSFIIDHPIDSEKYLVHACLEGPEAGVYYRGIGEILPSQKSTTIYLPEYIDALACNFTVQITRIMDDNQVGEEDDDDFTHLKTSLVKNHSFKVFGCPGKFFWHVYGQRGLFEIEPLKKNVNVKGNGPYKWI